MSWIGVDLDGTLATYNGWGDVSIGPAVPRMVMRVQTWVAQGKEVRLFTARAYRATDEELRAMEEWMLVNLGFILPITCTKDPGMLELWDDRAIQIRPNTGQRADGGTA